ncbi:MAG: hypothetical protein AB9836_10910 [Aminipila sp.]
MNSCNCFYNVNKIFVDECYEEEYIEFSKKLNHCLLCKYGKYYGGLQLYKQCDCFIVVSTYYNVCGLRQIRPEISRYIQNKYNECFGCEVERICILQFDCACRIIC